MPPLTFTKMHGLGNDFVLLHQPPAPGTDVATLAKTLCDRHFGIGADGLIWADAPSTPEFDVQFVYYNSDGSRAEMCGNGIRCFARFLQAQGQWPAHRQGQSIMAETPAGPIQLTLTGDNLVEVDMGKPVLEPALIPTALTAPQKPLTGVPVLVADHEIPLTPVSMGNPHAIIFQNPLRPFDPAVLGPLVEHHPVFPAKTNVEFVTVNSPTHVDVVVWERGCGFTLACGTGACAVVVAGVLTGKTARTVTVTLPGGDLHISWPSNDATVTMTGPATTVFSGTYQT
jgi:diaminopimelate epimerase